MTIQNTTTTLHPLAGRTTTVGDGVRCAALLNANARRVNKRVHDQIAAEMPGDVILTHSMREAEEAVGALLDEGVELVFAGGGDGTIVHLIGALATQLEARGIDPMDGPLVGLLPLGTGNALAAHFGISSAVGDLGLMTHGAPLRIEPLKMIESGGQCFPFAGMGVDGVLLNDYINIKRQFEGTLLESIITGTPAYALATLTTLGRMLDPRRSQPELRITNTGSTAYRVDAVTGEVLGSYAAGEELYCGPALIAAASTITCYGFGLKLFPQATALTDRFQLRLYGGGPVEPALQIPKLFDGTFSSRLLHDFLVDGISIDLAEPAPYQVAGDAMGEVRALQLNLSKGALPIAVPDRSKIH